MEKKEEELSASDEIEILLRLPIEYFMIRSYQKTNSVFNYPIQSQSSAMEKSMSIERKN